MDNSQNNRREFLRIYRNFILTFYEKDKPESMHDVSQVNNVSKGGVSFSSTHPLEQGIIVKIELKTPIIADAIHLEGVVLECREKIADMIYEIRLKFHDIPPQAMVVLEKIENYGNPEG